MASSRAIAYIYPSPSSGKLSCVGRWLFLKICAGGSEASMNSEIAMRQCCATNPVPTTTSCHRKRRALTGSLVCAPRCVEDLCTRTSLLSQWPHYSSTRLVRQCPRVCHSGSDVGPGTQSHHFTRYAEWSDLIQSLFCQGNRKNTTFSLPTPGRHEDSGGEFKVLSVLWGINSKCPELILICVGTGRK